jgi:hypothetical protein
MNDPNSAPPRSCASLFEAPASLSLSAFQRFPPSNPVKSKDSKEKNMKTKLSHIAAITVGLLILATDTAFSAPCTAARSIKSVRNTHIGNYEYVVFDVRRPPNPHYSVTTETGPFTEDASGNPVPVAGNKFKQIRFTGVFWTCTIAEVFSLPKTAIKDIKKTGQFEGVVTYVVGYRTASVYLGTYYYDVGNIRKVVMQFRR